MYVMTKKLLALSAPRRYYATYRASNMWHEGCKEKYDKMIALGNNPDPDKINEIIGNSSWTDLPECHECGTENAPVIIELETKHNRESLPTRLCKDCLNNIFDFLKEIR